MMPWPYPDDSWHPRADDPDARLAGRVREALREAGLPEVRVETQYGVVLLGGAVDDDRTRDLVAARVRTVPGVRDISNDLAVAPARFVKADPRRGGAGVIAARTVLVVAVLSALLADTAGAPLMIIGTGLIALAAALMLRRRGR
jgi:hypothetical protein